MIKLILYYVDDAALIGGSSQIAATAINAMAQSNLNKRTQKYNQDMYNKQRTDALSDWNMQNEYNSPSSQMARLQAAGLNPNLVYGHGADTTSGPVRSSSAGSWNPQAPDYSGVASAVGKYFQVKQQQLVLDNLKAQNTSITQDALLKQAQTAAVNASIPGYGLSQAKTGVDIDTGKFDLGLKQDLRSTSLDAAKAALYNQEVQTANALDANDRAALKTWMDMRTGEMGLQSAAQAILSSRIQNAKTRVDTARGYQDIANMQQMLKNLGTDNDLKNLDKNLKENGIQPGDNMFIRILSQWIAHGSFGLQGVPADRSKFMPGNP